MPHEATKKSVLKHALKSLEHNIQPTQSGPFFVAGANQFCTIWVRDFCYAVPGLLKAGYVKIVESQLRLILSFLSPQGFLPRGIDVVDPKFRVLWNTLLPSDIFPFSYKTRNLRPEFLGEHGTPAFDSNLLVLKAMADLAKFSKLAIENTVIDIESLLKIYESSLSNGLIHQPAYSDWQDSVKRSGPLLLTNVLYLYILRIYKYNLTFADKLETRILDVFFSSKENIFYETPERFQVSLDSHWFILKHSEIFQTINQKEIYRRLKAHPIWIKHSIPGIPVYPEHKRGDVSWTTKLVGLRHYHDGFHWGWLIAAAYQISELFNDTDESHRILMHFYNAHMGANSLSEIYECHRDQLTPAKRLLYISEQPFTWTAGFWIDSLMG